jgi:hypothetical protein
MINSDICFKSDVGASGNAMYVRWFPQIPIILIAWELSLIIDWGTCSPLLSPHVPPRFGAVLRSRWRLSRCATKLGVLQRSVKRSKLTPADRLLWASLCRVWQDWQSGVFIMKAATVLGWHRKGFRLFWR